jgi:WD40 repeat protein
MCKKKIFGALMGIMLASMVISGCQPTPTKESVPTQRTLPTLTEAPTQNVLPTRSQPTPTATVTPTATHEPNTIELGEPFWIGRGAIRNAIFLPGAKRVAIAWGNGVSLNNIENVSEVWFQPTSTDLKAFDMQPQGNKFAALLADSSVMLIGANDGKPSLFEGAKVDVYWGDLAWSPDGKTIAFQYLDYQTRSSPIYLLDTIKGQVREVPNSQAREGTPPLLIWSPDGLSITKASLGGDCPSFIDIDDGEVRMRLGEAGNCYLLSTMVFLPGNKAIAIAGQSEAVDLVEFPSGSLISSLEGSPGDSLGRLTLFPDVNGSLFLNAEGQWIVSMGGYEPCYCGSPSDQPYHPLIVWNLVTGKVLAEEERAITPLSELHRLAAAFDGEKIVMIYENGQITRWTIGDHQAVERISSMVPVRPAAAWTIRWSADGNHLAITGRYGGVDIYSTASKQLEWRIDPPLDSPALSPNGSLVAVDDPDHKIELVYQVKSHKLVCALPATPVLLGASFSPDGQYLAYGDGPKAMVTDMVSGVSKTLDPEQLTQMAPKMGVSRIIWSPDGHALATVFGVEGGDSEGPGVIVLWKRLADGNYKEIYHVPNVQANYTLPNQILAAFNPSGNRVALQFIDALEAGHFRLVVYDVEKGTVLRSLPEYKLGAWMNNDELLAAEAQYDTRLTRINVVTVEKVVGSGRDNGDNAYAPGGEYTAQMAMPPLQGVTIKYWRSNGIVAYLNHESLNLMDYGWSPDGRWLASIGDDGTLKVWPVMMR